MHEFIKNVTACLDKLIFILSKSFIRGKDLFVQSKRWKLYTSVWNMLKLTIKILERGHWRRSGFFIVNSEQISCIVLVFPVLTLNK